MLPFLVLVFSFGVLLTLGGLGFPVHFGWQTALRYALAGMFLLTASAHWGSKRKDLVRMVPPLFARPAMLVTITGVLEILGAIGLIWTRTAKFAALGLFLLLVAMFPANIRAARMGIGIGGKGTTPVVPRAIIQAVFLAATALLFL